MQLFSKRFPIELTNGKIIEIRALSATSTEQFKATYELLSKELKQEKYKKINITEGYFKEPLLKHYIQELFKIIEIDPEQISADSMYKLLFPHQTDDGGYERQGLLISFIVGEPKGGSKASKEEVDVYAQALGRLWASIQSYKESVNILDSLSYEDLEVVLKHRAEALKSPEEKAKDKAIKKAMETKEMLTKQFKTTGRIEIGKEINLKSLGLS